jgi:PadR family transcriptional regulator PadR
LTSIFVIYIVPKHMALNVFSREVKKGSAELLILALLEDGPRHGYEIGKLIDTRSGGSIRFQAASLYPMLYRLEKRGVIEGRWVEKAGQRRRRFYRLTAEGRRVLRSQRTFWNEFIAALDRVAKLRHA